MIATFCTGIAKSDVSRVNTLACCEFGSYGCEGVQMPALSPLTLKKLIISFNFAFEPSFSSQKLCMTGVTATMNQTYMLRTFLRHWCTTGSNSSKQLAALQHFCTHACTYQQERSKCAIKDEEDPTSKLQGYGNAEQIHILSLITHNLHMFSQLLTEDCSHC